MKSNGIDRNTVIAGVLALVIICGSAALLVRLKANQTLGEPGIKTSPLPESKNLLVELPADVPGFVSTNIETPEIVIETLPKDTSFGQRLYQSEDKSFGVSVNVVLMGADRTSLHKPEFCLTGAGWNIDTQEVTSIPMERPVKYDLPVQKFMVTRQFQDQGRVIDVRGIYVFWFVADDRIAARHWQRMWDMGKEMMKTGVLQRWAYVTYFSTCMPGQEEETYEKMVSFIQETVPEFQLTPGPDESQAPLAAR